MAAKLKTITNFDAGKGSRRMRALPTQSAQVAINTLISTYGATVVARSRWLCDNNPYAASAKESFVSSLVGTGMKPSFRAGGDPELKRELVELFEDWTDESDADGLTDFYGQQAMIASELFEAGECFVRFRPRRESDGLTVPLQLQVMPTEMLDLKMNEMRGGNRIVMGVEFDPIGRRVAYHFYKNHPHANPDNLGSVTIDTAKTRVPASEVLHLFKPLKAGQVRGIPHTLSSIIRLATLDAYDDAELERKRTAALFAVFVTRSGIDDDDHPLEGGMPETDLPSDDALANAIALAPGAVVDLEPGEGIETAAPADVGGSYEMFQYRALTSIAAGFGVPYSVMTGDFNKANYSSERASQVAYRRRITQYQNQVLVYQFCRPVIQRWLTTSIISGAVSISASTFAENEIKYRRVKWVAPKWEWVDPLKDLQAEVLAMEKKLTSRSSIIRSMGDDPETVEEEIMEDEARMPAPVQQAPQPPQGDQPSEDDPQEDDPVNPEEDDDATQE